MKRARRWNPLASFIGGGLFAIGFAAFAPADPPVDNPQGPATPGRKETDDGSPQQRRMIGLRVDPLPEGIPALLGLEPGVGLLVRQVMPDRPAATAGVQQHDLIVEINGAPARGPEDMMKAVQSADNHAVKLRLRRGTETIDLEVVPTLVDVGPLQVRGLPPGDLQEFLRQWNDPSEPFQFQRIGPGVIPPWGGEGQMNELHHKLDEPTRRQAEMSQRLEELMQRLDGSPTGQPQSRR